MMEASTAKERLVTLWLGLVEKLRPVAECPKPEPHLVPLTPLEAADIMVLMATEYARCETQTPLSADGKALMTAILQQWARPPKLVS